MRNNNDKLKNVYNDSKSKTVFMFIFKVFYFVDIYTII